MEDQDDPEASIKVLDTEDANPKLSFQRRSGHDIDNKNLRVCDDAFIQDANDCNICKRPEKQNQSDSLVSPCFCDF